MSDSVRPHRRQPTRLPRPWDSPGKNTGVGCHFLLQCMKVESESEVAQLCLTLCDPMDCSPPGSSVQGIFQARVLEWGAIAFSTAYLCLALDHSLFFLCFSSISDERFPIIKLPWHRPLSNNETFSLNLIICLVLYPPVPLPRGTALRTSLLLLPPASCFYIIS